MRVHGKRVLLVEDNEDDTFLALRALNSVRTNNRFEVEVAMDGAKALDLLLEQDDDGDEIEIKLPSLILLDVNLPRVDGLEVLRRLRADDRTQSIPVVIFSSSDSAEDIDASYKYGANSYLRKPALYSEYRAVLEQVGVYWLDANLCPPWDDF